jgi:hypothetical protein
MSVGSSGRRAARIAKTVVDLTWWLGLALCTTLVIVFLAAPALEHSGLRATFAWNAFEIDGGRGRPRSTIRIGVPDSATSTLIASIDTTLVTDIRLVGDGEATLEVALRRWSVFYAANAISVAMILATLGMVFLLRTFLSAVISEEVFTAPNAHRLSRLGWLLVVAGIAGPQLERLRAALIMSQVQLSDGAQLSLADVDGNTIWVLGVLVLVIAAAWRHGADLQMERELTV